VKEKKQKEAVRLKKTPVKLAIKKWKSAKRGIIKSARSLISDREKRRSNSITRKWKLLHPSAEKRRKQKREEAHPNIDRKIYHSAHYDQHQSTEKKRKRSYRDSNTTPLMIARKLKRLSTGQAKRKLGKLVYAHLNSNFFVYA
jgi:hypothetical protein